MAQEATSPAAAQPTRILIADDDLYVRTLLKKAIGTTAAVAEVTHGDEVVETYMRLRPDILFLDIHLPGRMGTDILSEIIALDASAYIVMLSADSSEENVLNATRLGAKFFLTKPFTKDKVLAVIERCPTIRPAGEVK